MPETLSITFDALRRELGRFLGFRIGTNDSVTSWSDEQIQDVNDIIKSGLRLVYWPVIASEQGSTVYQWSFLKKRSTITLVVGTFAYDLPTDYGGMISWPTFPAGSNKRILERQSEEDLVTLYAKNDQSGVPVYGAVRAKDTTYNSATSYELLVYPRPLEAATLSFRYVLDPPMLADDNQIPLGGPQLSMALLEACLSEAEKMLGDTEGLHYKKFQEALSRCIQYDQQFE